MARHRRANQEETPRDSLRHATQAQFLDSNMHVVLMRFAFVPSWGAGDGTEFEPPVPWRQAAQDDDSREAAAQVRAAEEQERRAREDQERRSREDQERRTLEEHLKNEERRRQRRRDRWHKASAGASGAFLGAMMLAGSGLVLTGLVTGALLGVAVESDSQDIRRREEREAEARARQATDRQVAGAAALAQTRAASAALVRGTPEAERLRRQGQNRARGTHENEEEDSDDEEAGSVPGRTSLGRFEADDFAERAFDPEEEKALFLEIVQAHNLTRLFSAANVSGEMWKLPTGDSILKWFDIAVLPRLQTEAETLLYVGTFFRGRMHGEGLIVASEGARPLMFSEFHNGLPHGNGALFQDGRVIAKLRFDAGVLRQVVRYDEATVGDFHFDSSWSLSGVSAQMREAMGLCFQGIAKDSLLEARPGDRVVVPPTSAATDRVQRGAAPAGCSSVFTRQPASAGERSADRTTPGGAEIAAYQGRAEQTMSRGAGPQNRGGSPRARQGAGTQTPSRSHRVLTAFSRESSGLGRKFEDELTSRLGRGFEVTSAMPAAQRKFDRIANMVRESEVIMPLLTPNFLRCKHCLSLLVSAQREMKPCIPVNANGEVPVASFEHMIYGNVLALLESSDWSALEDAGILPIDVMSAIEWVMRRTPHAVHFRNQAIPTAQDQFEHVANLVRATTS